MLGTSTMPAPKKSTAKKPIARRPKVPAVEPTRADGRAKSALTLAGEQAARDAKRALLLKALKDNGWNLTRTAESLNMGSTGNVARALQELAPDEYEAAKKRGDIAMGRPTD